MKKQNNQGITLIALVITIIVLLILAGVALRLVAGDEGILGRAEKAVSKSNTTSLQEEIELAISEARIAYYDGEKEAGATSASDNVIKKLQNGIETSQGEVRLNNGKLSIAGKEIGTYSSETGVKINNVATGENETIDWDAILAKLRENPESMKHSDQTTKSDVGIGTDGKPVNLDYWRYSKNDSGDRDSFGRA